MLQNSFGFDSHYYESIYLFILRCNQLDYLTLKGFASFSLRK